jgi:F420-0:gamma-glutamyl ligase
MKIKSVKTRPVLPPKDDILGFIGDALSKENIKEKSIIVVTSKIVAIGQGRCVKMDSVKDKDDLIKKEADCYLDRKEAPNKWVMLTIKNNILIPTAGIDESNGNGHYILWPENPFEAAREIHGFIKKKFGLKELGVIISDSHTTPLRLGVGGIALSHFGFKHLRDYVGSKDIFGRPMKMSKSNIADSIADAAVLVMGECAEQTTLAIVEDIGFVNFDYVSGSKDPLEIEPENDLYAPLLKAVNWRKGGSPKI